MMLLQYFKDGFVVRFVVSAGFVTASFMSYYYLLWLNSKPRRSRVKVSPLTLRNNNHNHPKEPDHHQLIKLPLEILELQRSVARMSFNEISKATNKFSNNNIIGFGKMGTMYKAMLHNGWLLAVKRLNPSQHLHKHFISELKSLGGLRHNNLVPLLGFCIKKREWILVYKYMSNGNLYEWLHPLENKAMPMELPLKLKIAVGVARGLAWLHHQCNFRLAHLNISSNSILLDQNLEPKLSNFSGAMFMNPSDPDSSRSWELDCVKKDVYDFGVVLLELITQKQRSQMNISSSGSLEEPLVEWVTQLLSSVSVGRLYDSIDKSLLGQAFDYEIFILLRIAYDCVQPLSAQRPSMLHVYKKLRAMGERYGPTHDSGMSKPPQIAADKANEQDTTLEIVEII